MMEKETTREETRLSVKQDVNTQDRLNLEINNPPNKYSSLPNMSRCTVTRVSNTQIRFPPNHYVYT